MFAIVRRTVLPSTKSTLTSLTNVNTLSNNPIFTLINVFHSITTSSSTTTTITTNTSTAKATNKSIILSNSIPLSSSFSTASVLETKAAETAEETTTTETTETTEEFDINKLPSIQQGFPAYEPADIQAWVHNWLGQKIAIVSLENDVFGASVRSDIVNNVVNWQLAKRKAPVRKVKTRSEVAGSMKKIYAQKKTGRARRGAAKKSPLVRGGGKAHGPVFRYLDYNMPAQVRKHAVRSALAAKFSEGNLIVIDAAQLDTHKTKPFYQLLANLGLSGNGSVLIVDGDQMDPNFILASRNIYHVNLLPSRGINVFDIVKHKKLVMTLSGLRHVQAKLLSKAITPPYPFEPAPVVVVDDNNNNDNSTAQQISSDNNTAATTSS